MFDKELQLLFDGLVVSVHTSFVFIISSQRVHFLFPVEFGETMSRSFNCPFTMNTHKQSHSRYYQVHHNTTKFISHMLFV